jgi:hypothetical protein
VSGNEQLSPEQGAPGAFVALLRAEGKAVCATLAGRKRNRQSDGGGTGAAMLLLPPSAWLRSLVTARYARDEELRIP